MNKTIVFTIIFMLLIGLTLTSCTKQATQKNEQATNEDQLTGDITEIEEMINGTDELFSDQDLELIS